MQYSSLLIGVLLVVPCIVQAEILPDIGQAFTRYTELGAGLSSLLETVHDRQSADAAAPQLQAKLLEVYECRTELQRLSLSEELQKEVRQKYGHSMQVAWGKVYESVFRLQKTRCYNSLQLFKQFHLLCAMLDQ